jgi:hypothetical protein
MYVTSDDATHALQNILPPFMSEDWLYEIEKCLSQLVATNNLGQ